MEFILDLKKGTTMKKAYDFLKEAGTYPNLRNMYTTGESGNSVVSCLKDTTAVIYSFTHTRENVRF